MKRVLLVCPVLFTCEVQCFTGYSMEVGSLVWCVFEDYS